MPKSLSMFKYKFIVLLTISVIVISCAPKPEEIVVKEPKKEPTHNVKQAPENPCVTFDKLNGGQRDEVETAYVLYKDYLKEKKYAESLPYWKTAYYGAPASNGRVKYQFDDGVKLYTHYYQKEEDATKKKALLDTVMAIYDKRMECFGDEAYIQGRKAFDYYYTFPGNLADGEIYKLFKKNIDTKGKKADYFIINPFTKLLNDGIIDGSISHEEGAKYAGKIFDAIKYGQANCKGKYCDAWKTIADYAPVRLESLEGIDGFYNCGYYADKYYPMYQKDPTNCDLVKQVYRRMLRGGCTTDDPRLDELQKKKATDCYTAPPAPGLLRQGFDAYNSGKYTEAVTHFEGFVAKSADISKKFKYTMLIAKIYYRDIKNYPKSRQYAKSAAQMNPSSGEPAMLIGKLYASSGPLCGSGTGWNSQVVTWVAIDKFIEAKRKDPSVAAAASKLISQYRQYMPNKEDVFQRRIKAGDTYKVPCWIQENTKVRTAD